MFYLVVYSIARLVFYLPIPIVYKQVMSGSSRSSFDCWVIYVYYWPNGKFTISIVVED